MREPQVGAPSRVAYLSGNYCRCTGYEAIVDAVATAARLLAGNGTESAPDRSL
jgi:xanthine dehydrogenase iron-sulfur cluster and FAD-binding subunit A